MAKDKACLDCGQDRTGGSGRGLCGRCLYKRKRSGVELPPPLRVSFEQRLAAMDKPVDGCWPWTGYISPCGYGGLGVSRTHASPSAHVRSYIHHKGPITPGLDVGHACHDRDLSCRKVRDCPHRACINPEHLVLQTRSENIQAIKRSTHCKYGHEFSPENTRLTKLGHRRCRACARRLALDTYRSRRELGGCEVVHQVTECPHGHPYTTENSYIAPDGNRMCRTCLRQQGRRRSRRSGHPAAP